MREVFSQYLLVLVLCRYLGRFVGQVADFFFCEREGYIWFGFISQFLIGFFCKKDCFLFFVFLVVSGVFAVCCVFIGQWGVKGIRFFSDRGRVMLQFVCRWKIFWKVGGLVVYRIFFVIFSKMRQRECYFSKRLERKRYFFLVAWVSFFLFLVLGLFFFSLSSSGVRCSGCGRYFRILGCGYFWVGIKVLRFI